MSDVSERDEQPSEPVRGGHSRAAGLRSDGGLLVHTVRRGIPLLALLLVLGAAYLVWQLTDAAPAPETAPPPAGPVAVQVYEVRPETVPMDLRFLGQTEGSQVVDIRARVAGYLQERLFREGERVEEGEKLFQIDPRPFEVELAQAEARLARAEATRAQARQQLRRYEDLIAREAGTEAELEDWQTQELVASADVQQAQAQIAAAELQLGYTSIEAPLTGVIGRVLKDRGSYVDAGQDGLLAVIQQVDPIYVRYSVTEQEVLRFQRGLSEGRILTPGVDAVELEITLADGSVYPYRGRINFIDVQVDQTTGTSVVRGQVPNPDGMLRPGQFIYARVLGVDRVGVVRVPQRAVQQSPTGASVLVVGEGGVAENRPVRLGQWSGADHWIIERGLEQGDLVITDRLMMVRPGSAVEVAETVVEPGPASGETRGDPAPGEGE